MRRSARNIPWLPITMQGVADIAPSATPPTQIGTEGELLVSAWLPRHLRELRHSRRHPD